MAFPRVKIKAAHHRGTHQVRARAVVQAAYANPATRCWRCHHLLPDCRPHRNGKPAYWTAGHLIDGQIDGHLAPECSSCNYSHGARLGNTRQNVKLHPRSDLTW